MGQCPRCADRMEFSAGRCARSLTKPEPTNLEELEQKVLTWITKNKQEIKDALAQKQEMKSKTLDMSWRDYDTEFEQEVRSSGYRVIKFTTELTNIIPVLGRIYRSHSITSPPQRVGF